MAESYGVTRVEAERDELLAGGHPVVTMPVTVASGSGVLARGTVMGRVSATGKWKPYDKNATDGSQEPRGILAEDVDASSEDAMSVVYVHGEFKEKALTGFVEEARLPLMERGIYVK